MKSCLVLIVLIVTNSQLLSEPLPKFALLTVTYARNQSFQTILNYLTHYAQTECYQSLISQICIIWNNEERPENVGALDRQLYWRMPVYFYLTKNNSLNHRFRVPKEANADLYYSLDDDIFVDCDTLRLTYAHYIGSQQSNLKGIVTNEARNYGFLINKRQQFQYQGHSYASYYSIAQTGASFFPKHYLNLYFLNIEEINLLREKVDQVTSCQDIFFMGIAQHFYPQMAPKYYAPQAGYKNTNPMVGLSRKPGLVALRTSCILYLTEILGYNPLRQFSKSASLYEDNWQFPNHNIIMQTKIQGLINIPTIQSQQRVYTSSLNPPNTQLRPQPQNQLQQPSSEVQMEEQVQQVQQAKQVQASVVPAVQMPESINQLKQEMPVQEQVKAKQKVIIEDQSNNKIPYSFQIIVFILVLIIMILIVSVYRLYRKYSKLKKAKYHASINEEEGMAMANQQV